MNYQEFKTAEKATTITSTEFLALQPGDCVHTHTFNDLTGRAALSIPRYVKTSPVQDGTGAVYLGAQFAPNPTMHKLDGWHMGATCENCQE